MNQVGVTTNDNNKIMFGTLNHNFYNMSLTKLGSTESDSMTGSTDETNMMLKKQYQTGINKTISNVIYGFTDALLLPEYLANKFDEFVESYIKHHGYYDYVDSQSGVSDPNLSVEYIYYQIKKYIPKFMIDPRTINKISGAIQFNRINHTTISEDFLENLVEQSTLQLEKQSNAELLEALLKLQKIIEVKEIVSRKQKRLDGEFQKFLIEY